MAKMHIEIPYGRGKVLLRADRDRIASVVHPNRVEKKGARAVLDKALSAPMNSKSLDEFLSDARDVLLIVNDATRPTPTSRVLEAIERRMRKVPFKVLVATGVHRGPTEEEFDFIFGSLYETYRDRIHVHDARRTDCMIHVGTSRNGTEMHVNRMGVDAEKIMLIGSVEPHYFAGYTGGRKSFLPGIASYRTIEQNHRFALSARAKSLALEGNPVHEDMMDALESIRGKEIFSIQTVLDGDRDIYDVAAGDLGDSFYKAVESAKEVFCARLSSKTDIVISVACHPMDVDLYQSQKAIDNGRLALNPGGILIIVSTCRDGIGEKAFYDLLCSCGTPGEVLHRIEREYKLGWHKAQKMAEVMADAQVWAVTDLEERELERVFIKPFNSIQEAFDAAISEKGRDAKATILMDGSITVPLVGG